MKKKTVHDNTPKQDPLYDLAKQTVIDKKSPEVSTIQRALRISYSHARRLLHALEGDVVSPPDNYGHRQLLTPS